MAWTDESHLSWHVLLVTPIAVARRDLSPVTGTVTEFGNEDKQHQQIAMWLLLSL